jgi:hypothetical protein
MVRDIAGLISRLFEDAVSVAKAEVQLAKSKAFAKLQGAKIAIALVFVALLIVQATLSACFVGLVIGLVPLVGAWLAALILLVAGLAVAGLLGWLALRQISAPGEVAAKAAASVDAAIETVGEHAGETRE